MGRIKKAALWHTFPAREFSLTFIYPVFSFELRGSNGPEAKVLPLSTGGESANGAVVTDLVVLKPGLPGKMHLHWSLVDMGVFL